MLQVVLSVLQGLIALASSWYRSREDSRLIDAGAAQAQSSILKKEANEISIAVAARNDARAGNLHVPAGVSMPDDGFRRD